MNIGQLLHGLLGDMQLSEPKQLELKVGEIVKGVVLKLLSDQEALLNIGGVRVNAKLETPLIPGQVTLLQVQPESRQGQILLKPLQNSPEMTELSAAQLLKVFGMKDAPVNKQILLMIQQAGISLTKESLQMFQQSASVKPSSVPLDEWIQSGITAFHKGLPLVEDIVLPLHQAVYGKPLHQLLTEVAASTSRLQAASEQASAVSVFPALSAEENSGLTTAFTNKPALEQLLEAIRRLSESVDKGESPIRSGPIPSSEGSAAPAAGESRMGRTASTLFEKQTGAAAEANFQSRTEQFTAAASLSAASDKAVLRPNDFVSAGSSRLDDQVRESSGEQQITASGHSASDRNESKPSSSQPSGNPAFSQGESHQAASTQQDSRWISDLLKVLGVQHEREALTMLEKQERQIQLIAADEPQRAPGEDGQVSTAIASPDKPADTLKGHLLSLLQAQDLPADLKVSAQQLLGQITGQQLLMQPDKSSMISHVTLYLPILNSDGEQTAAVHIQSRKGKRGQLDAQNCRILFDLQMKYLGRTITDVQVVNRTVSLRMLNDHPEIGDMTGVFRKELAAVLDQIGFQFLSMKFLPFPKVEADGERAADASASNPAIDPAGFRARPYKGVDFRI